MTTAIDFPVAWMLFNVRTGKADTTKAYVRREVAELSAKTRSSQWRQFVAAPVFLVPDEGSRSESILPGSSSAATEPKSPEPQHPRAGGEVEAEDELRQMLKDAYIAGCCATEQHFSPGAPGDDFGEAGDDYAHSALSLRGSE